MATELNNRKSNTELPSWKNDRFWLETIYLVLFYILYQLAGFGVMLLGVVQWGYRLMTGTPNPDLANFGGQLAEFIQQCVDFLAGKTSEKPFPFSDWPRSE